MYRYVLLLAALMSVLLGACGKNKEQDEESKPQTVSPAQNPGGKPAPDFTLPSSDGESVSLSDYQEPVLLFFHMAEG